MLTKIYTAVVKGMEGQVVTIEVDVERGMPQIQIVGLADTMVREAKERIRGAIINSGLDYPKGRITINLAPADLRKKGSHMDLAMAMGLLASSNEVLNWTLDKYAFIGELSLDGSVNKVSGLLPMMIALEKKGVKRFIVPQGNKAEAGLVSGVEVMVVDYLKEVVDYFNRKVVLKPLENLGALEKIEDRSKPVPNIDFKDVKGQEEAKRALMIAVAGNHGMLMKGSPGCGKTMLAERIPTIMPSLTYNEIIETTIIYSVAGLLDGEQPLVTSRPFRNPHSRASAAVLLGGGQEPRAGEITLAHRGVLFLDELAEYDRNVIEMLRIPLEKKKITMVRKGEVFTYPADFLLVGATNPCKCGYYGDPTHECKCTDLEVERYRKKLSGPILDRIDLHLQLHSITYNEYEREHGLTSLEMKSIVERTVAIEEKRYEGWNINRNSQLDDGNVEQVCMLGEAEKSFMENAYLKFKMNPRTLNKVLKISRTIADINENERVTIEDIAEALRYRPNEIL